MLLSQSPNLRLTNDFEQVMKGCAEKHKETKNFPLNMVNLANMWLQILTPKSSLVPCCHPLLSTNKNISLLQNLCFLHPLVLLYVLFIVHLFVLLPRGSHFSDSCRIFWTLLCIFFVRGSFQSFP